MMWFSADPSLRSYVIEYAIELIAERVLARNPNLSKDEGTTEILAAVKQELIMAKHDR